MIIDDSLLIRQVLTKELSKYPDITIIAQASNPIEAKPLILKHKPDVITLDIEMPKMDGITFLSVLQKFYPVPVVMLSTLTEQGSELAIQALQKGAVEVMHKPNGGSFLALNKVIDELAFKIRSAAASKRTTIKPIEKKNLVSLNNIASANKLIIAIGASTGGTEALRFLFKHLPNNLPPIVITQHMPETFTASFAKSLDSNSAINVRECRESIDLRPGLAALARGGKHMILKKTITGYKAVAVDGEPVCHQKPSVDVMFDSVAKIAKANAIGVILTGMGADGAQGMLTMRQFGALTIAQDEQSCVVFGMPKEAIALGGAMHVLPLEKIPAAIISAVKLKANRKTDDNKTASSKNHALSAN